MSAIVLIEDTPQSARLAARLLRLAGHEVIVAQDGEMGLAAVMDGPPPDLVLVDQGLPDLDGQTVVALLRQQRGLDTVPIIAFTAWPQDTAHKMALAYGCDGVITKPIDTRTFVSQVEAHIKRQRVQP